MVTVASRQDLISSAAEGIYSLSIGDASARIAEANAAYGLARIRLALERRGVDSRRAVCIFTPDGGITRNKERWAAGFGYGCLIRWPDKAEAGRAFAFPEIKPNACGTIVAKLTTSPRVEQIWERLQAAKGSQLTLEGSMLKLNLGVSNHFIEVCRVTRSHMDELTEGDVIAVMHTSPSELKDELYDFGRWVERGGSYDDTPLGPILVLEGAVAERYYRVYQEVEYFSWRKRLHLTQVIFGEHQVISNATHQGLFADNVAGLGVYRTQSDLSESIGGLPAPPATAPWEQAVAGGIPNIFPLTLRHDLPVYLMRGWPNLRRETIASAGLAPRASDLGHTDILEGADLLPHGGGYRLLVDPSSLKVTENGSKRFYELFSGHTKYVFSDPRELPYDYRGLEVLHKIESLRLGDVVTEAKQLYTLKY